MWKDIPGYENEYQMSDSAAIKRKDGHGADGRLLTEKTLKASRASNGKSYICLWKNGKRKSYMLHKIYAKTFGISEKEAVRRVYEDSPDAGSRQNMCRGCWRKILRCWKKS